MRSLLVPLALASIVCAHGGGDHQKPIVQVDPNADWTTRHMAEEHHITDFDPSSFFTLHDYDSSGGWDESEVLKTYGLKDESTKDVPQAKRDAIVNEVFKLLDVDGDGQISRNEYLRFVNSGQTLPDFGLGPGHHGDDEYEYEIHHWELYHDENTKEEDLIHPEDIEHFRKHDEMDAEADRVAALDKYAIVEDNIPKKFWKGQ